MIDILLLLGLPAAGKSEIRRYLGSLEPASAAGLRLGPPVHLDDEPYLLFMRRISRELRRLRRHPVFFATEAEPFLEPRDWLTLTGLLDEDYAALTGLPEPPRPAAAYLLDRLERARVAAGLPGPFTRLPAEVRGALEGALEAEAAALVQARAGSRPPSLAGHTVLIELARGARPWMRPPFPAPWGYAHSLARFSPAILERAACLYVWVTPTESRRRNQERSLPVGAGAPPSPALPEQMLLRDFARDDLAWLLDHADRSGNITLAAHGRRFQIPAVRFDNRVDRTSFLRADPASWPAPLVEDLHRRLAGAFDLLLRRGRRPT